MTRKNSHQDKVLTIPDQVERAKQEWEVTVDSLPQMICLLDKESKIIRANRTVESWGLSSVNEVKGQTLHQLFHNDCTRIDCYLKTDWPRHWQQVIARQSIEFEIKDDLVKRFLHFQIRPVTSGTQRRDKLDNLAAIVIIEDITEQKLVDQALDDAQTQIRTLFENAPYGITLTSVSGKILATNRGMTSITGYSEKELLQRNVTEFYVNPDQRAELLQQLDNSGAVRNFGLEALRKDGSLFYASLSVSKLAQAGQNILLAVIEDETERINIEKELQRREQELNNIVENSPDTIARFDRDTRHLFVSRAISTITDLPPQHFLGYSNRELNLPEDVTVAFEENLEYVFETGNNTYFEFPFTASKGKRDYEAHLAPEFAEDGSVESVLVVGRDISERKEIRKKLQAAIAAAEEARQQEIERRQEAERRRRTAESLGDVLTALNSNQPLSQILNLIATRAKDLLDIQAVVVCSLDDETDSVSVQAAHGLSVDSGDLTVQPAGFRTLQNAFAGGQTVIHANLAVNSENLLGATSPLSKYQAVLVIPILLNETTVYGGLLLCYTEQPSLSQEENDLAALFATQAALAIENAQLKEQGEEAAVTKERNRIARELHDSVTQALFTSSLIAEALPALLEKHPEEAARSVQELRALTQGGLAEMRTLLLELRPGELADRNLGELLRQLADGMSARTQLPITTSMSGNCDMPTDVQIALYRITQEALNNIVKHARARHAWINLQCRSNSITLRVRDDGRGFEATNGQPHQFGLDIMRERAQNINATISINSRPNEGTNIKVEWLALMEKDQ